MKPYFEEAGVKIFHGDCLSLLASLDDNSIDCCVTSPPYWGLRDYGIEPSVWADGWRGALGLEPTPQLFIEHIVSIFEQVRRVLKPDGTCWLNIGDSYANDTKWGGSTSGKHVSSLQGNTGVGRGKRLTGLKPKDLCLIPFRLAIALQEAGWYVRSDIIWAKPNPMPESVTDRPTKAHEYIFLLAKSEKYWFDADAVAEPNAGKKSGNGYKRSHRLTYAGRGQEQQYEPDKPRNIRSVWTIATQPFPEAHFAVYPEKLVEPCIKAGCPPGGLVLDPFVGAGTSALVARRLGCRFVGAELNAQYIDIAAKRLSQGVLQWG